MGRTAKNFASLQRSPGPTGRGGELKPLVLWVRIPLPIPFHGILSEEQVHLRRSAISDFWRRLRIGSRRATEPNIAEELDA